MMTLARQEGAGQGPDAHRQLCGRQGDTAEGAAALVPRGLRAAPHWRQVSECLGTMKWMMFRVFVFSFSSASLSTSTSAHTSSAGG